MTTPEIPQPGPGTGWERARVVLRQPGRPDTPLVAGPDDEGIVSALAGDLPRTFSQRALDTRLTAWLYDRIRDQLLRVAGMPDFATEVAAVAERLQPAPGDVVLDLACGHGNFTVAWAERVGPNGLVIGVDLSRAMLRRAARRVRRARLDNVVLVHGDAHHLPLASASADRVNCSGGFHAFPDLTRVLGEIARVAKPGAPLTASTFAQAPEDRLAKAKRLANTAFALHFVPLAGLDGQLNAAGFSDYQWSMRGGAFAYLSARSAEV